MPQGIRTTLVILVLGLVLVGVAAWGFQRATEPFPGKADAPKCLPAEVAQGEKVFTDQVTVSVYNASERNGLAGRTMGQLEEVGFGTGDTGNAPRDTEVRYAEIWTETPQAPDVLLVAAHLGPNTEIVRRNSRGVGVTVMVGQTFEELVRAPRKLRAGEDATICSPPVT